MSFYPKNTVKILHNSRINDYLALQSEKISRLFLRLSAVNLPTPPRLSALFVLILIYLHSFFWCMSIDWKWLRCLAMIKMIENAKRRRVEWGVRLGWFRYDNLMFVIIQLIEFDKKDIFALLLVLSIQWCYLNDFFRLKWEVFFGIRIDFICLFMHALCD